MANPQNTLQVLRWAKRTSNENEMVRIFWENFCDAINEKPSISAIDALKELRFYGSNTLLRPFRDNPIPYDEVAYDVANTLKPFFGERDRFSLDNLSSCEDYVLEKMKISHDDLEKICEAIGDKCATQNKMGITKRVGTISTGNAILIPSTMTISKRLAEKTLTNTSKKVASKAAQKLAEEAAKESAKQIAVRIIAVINIFLSFWLVISIAGPALRVTIKAVTYIALLRKMYMQSLIGV